MSYLSLFTFSMMMLVVSDNFVQLFFGWEGVGLCSYLLIGFWYKKASANAAAIKAFVVNRVGDLGLAVGIFMLYFYLGSVEFSRVFASAPTLLGQKLIIFGFEAEIITIICIMLFIGCMGKSAQIGLHTWLPDAMEGPTPVSALIHAATMVTAGVFLVARCSALFELSKVALNMIMIIGAVTAIFAASIALVQNDIKKIIAYSTCSQLGYMFFACGASAYASGIFHLATHACFKALLFLGAGSVIHSLLDEQDIRKMGGLWNKIPITYILFWIGSLALAGVYPFAGFFSKDAILEYAYAANSSYGLFAYWVGIVVAFMTAFYSWRLLIKVFHGKCSVPHSKLQKIHESGSVMLIPLYILAFGSIIFGLAGHYLHIDYFGSEIWSGVLTVLGENDVINKVHKLPIWIEKMPSVAGVLGILFAYLCYSFLPQVQSAIYNSFASVRFVLERKYFFDDLYDRFVVGMVQAMSLLFWRFIDAAIIDGMPNASAYIASRFGRMINFAQSGYFYHYALVIIFGLVMMLSWILFFV